MINVQSANDLASQLEAEARNLQSIINNYNTVQTDLNKNTSIITKKYIGEVNDNLKELKNCQAKLKKISETIKTKAKEIKEKEETEKKK